MYKQKEKLVQPTAAIGRVIAGSLSDGFVMRISSSVDLDNLKAGTFVSIIGTEYRFFSMITNIYLEQLPSQLVQYPPTHTNTLLWQRVKQHYLHATAVLRPMVTLNNRLERSPVTSIPAHFCTVTRVNAQEITAIFGSEKEDSETYFSIGTPLEMDASVCLNMPKLLERSNGIFGKTGTGKTFLTRLVLAGVIKNTNAVTLIFDMHSEYGLQARKEGSHESFVKGLKTLFPNKIAIFSLDPASTKRRGASPDVVIKLSYQALQVEDILSLQQELNLHPTACESAYLLEAKFKNNWLNVLLSSADRLKELAQDIGCHPESLTALHRKLKQIQRLPFFDQSLTHDIVIEQLLEYLQRGVSVIIEFGNFTSTFCYLLLANIITRRIHALYIEKTEKFLGSHKKEDEPRKLLITIEEAHKFLNIQTARQTIFGTIAREMRKYYVSLLVIDQRPSGIDPEILSQLGTKIVAQLSDEKDIQAVLTGTHGSQELRTVLSTLDSKKQVLLMGHAIPMPIVIQTRSYDESFYAALTQATPRASLDQLY
ncbi:MAG: DUF87 domain-containing protein [Candidatus Babeliaceae bacterium]|nr:DUF87 domain-containing protein [Candidatus Babeliaceae bacterium]